MRLRFLTLAAAFLLASSSVEAQPSEPSTPASGTSPSTAPAAPAGPPTAAAIAEAKERFRRALELHDEGNLDAARMELRRAYDTAPNYKVLYNLAQVEFEALDYAAALRSFERYLNEGGSRIPKDRRTQVQSDIEKLRSRLGNLEIAVNVPGAQIAIDDVVIGTSPLVQPVLLNAGHRRVTVSRQGFTSQTRTIDVAGGDHPALSVELTEAPAAEPPPAAPAPEPEAPAPAPSPPPAETPSPAPDQTISRSSVPWAGWVTTAVLAAGAGVTGGLALQRSQQLSSDRSRYGAERSELDRLQNEATVFALASDICAGGAAFAGLLSLYFTLSSSSNGEHKADQGRSIRVAPALGFVSVEGSF